MKYVSICMILVGIPLSLSATAALPAVLGGVLGGIGLNLLFSRKN